MRIKKKILQSVPKSDHASLFSLHILGATHDPHVQCVTLLPLIHHDEEKAAVVACQH